MVTVRMATRSAAVVLALGVAAVGVPAVAGAGAASAPAPRLVVSPREAHPQQANVRVAGSGFTPGERFTLKFGTTRVGGARSDSSGRVSVAFTVPTWARPGPHVVSLFDGTERAEAPLVVRTNWAMSGFDPADTADNRFENVARPATVGSLSEVWNTGEVPSQYQIGAPAVSEGTVYVGEYQPGASTVDSELAVDAATGHVSILLPKDGSSWAPTITNNEIILSGLSGLTAYTLGDGNENPLWSIGDAGGGEVLTDGVLYSGGCQKFYAVDPITGSVLWSTPVPVALCDQPIAVDGDMAFGAFGDTLVGINLTTESVAWTATAPDQWAQLTRPTASSGVVVVGGDGLLAYSESTGALLWTASDSVGAQGMVSDGLVYAFGAGGLEARSLQTGELTWSNPNSGIPVALAGGVLYAHDADGLGAVNATTGASLWSQGTAIEWDGEDVPAVANGVVYDSSQTLGLAAFTPTPSGQASASSQP